MELSVLNKIGSNITLETQVKIIWTVFLFGQRVDISGEIADYFHLVLDYANFSEKAKMISFFNILRGNGMSEREVQEKETMYKQIQEVRRIKYKSKLELTLYMKGERIIKGLLAGQNEWFKQGIKNYKTEAIFPFVCTNSEDDIKSIFAWNFPYQDEEKSTQTQIRVIASRLLEKELTFVFPEQICEFATLLEMGITNRTAENKSFLSDLLLKIPAPESLTSSQVGLIRNEFSNVTWTLFDQLGTLYEPMSELCYEPGNYDAIIKLYKEKSDELKIKLLELINKNEFFNQLKNEPGYLTDYYLYAGISSFETITMFFKKFDIISETAMMYINEQINETLKINTSRLFLYMNSSNKLSI